MKLAWVGLLLSCASALAQQPVTTVEVELQGPLHEVRLEAGHAATHIELELDDGESRRLLVPVEVHESQGSHRPSVDVGPECARVLGETAPPRRWRELPLGLQSRALPSLARKSQQLGPVRWFWLAAAGLLVFASRRRPARALLVGGVAAAGVFLLPAPVARDSTVVVLEGVASGEGGGAETRWLEVRGARDVLDLAVGGDFWVRALPRDDDFHLGLLEVDGELRWRACAPGARAFAFRELERGPSLTRAENQLEDLDRVWLREPGAGWTSREPWAKGAALPPGLASGGPALPGWLAAALPQGVSVLIARSNSPEGTRWVRLVGF